MTADSWRRQKQSTRSQGSRTASVAVHTQRLHGGPWSLDAELFSRMHMRLWKSRGLRARESKARW
eukprot:4367147-Pleurochrysis_carterae.AAC.1